MTQKHLDNLPPCILRFYLRLIRFDYQISMYLASIFTLQMHFQTPVHQIPSEEVLTQQEEVEYFVQSVTSYLPASKGHLEVYCQAQSTDRTCSAVMSYCTTGWPRKQMFTDNRLPYWKVHGQLSLYDDLLLYRSQIIVPAKLQQTTLYKTHPGHQGIQRCRLRIASSVWWPGVSKAIEHYVQNCPQYLKSHIPPKERTTNYFHFAQPTMAQGCSRPV